MLITSQPFVDTVRRSNRLSDFAISNYFTVTVTVTVYKISLQEDEEEEKQKTGETLV